ncbi:DUF2384 domain-containing protein [Patescibacteria group bacterium]|nr:DUF2384 domain-containing protein [Patescibacteria group bacterium]
MKKRKRFERHFEAFMTLAEQWKLSEKERRQLLNIKSERTFLSFATGKEAPPAEVLTRMHYCMQIYRALHILLPSYTSANDWIHAANKAPLFQRTGYKTALEAMLSDNIRDLKTVHDYLLAQLHA